MTTCKETGDTNASIPDVIRVLPQYLLPQHLLSRFAYRITRLEYEPLKDILIRTFISLYKVEMNIAVKPDPGQYLHFNDFFTRSLKPDSRPVAMQDECITSPVDGAISQIGDICADRIFQAKGHDYSTIDLLGGNEDMARSFSSGRFATLYLSPRDYHRIHMPIAGQLRQTIHVPGRLFAVNAHTTRVVDNLFARNERVICIFDTGAGLMAVILVGAIFVGSIETVWGGEITPSSNRDISTINHDAKNITLQKGQEMGRFNMGSTVILLFSRDSLQWLPTMVPGKKILMGEKLGLIDR